MAAPAAPVVMEGCMGSMENPSPKAISYQSTEDWEAVAWASEILEGEEVSLDDLAECMKKSMKPFAQRIIQVLEKCQERRESFSEACAQLKDVCQSCDQQDRLIIAGSGNVGKSTIANALLGRGKFLPTAKFCMTSCICEAHYNAASDATPIAPELVQKSATPGSEECHRTQKPLQVWHPSPLLKPDVILVDLPGLDQEREYMERLEEYMISRSASSVALLYVIDVNNKICNPDREFFEKLQRSPWQDLSQSLGLLVNKCDMGGDETGASSEEEAPDYAKLLADITEEAQNYCTPKVMDLSMKDKKKDHPEAMVKWQEVEDYAHNAVAQLKSRRLIQILLSLEKVMDMLWLAAQDDQHLRAELEKREKRLSQAEDKVKQLVDGKDKWKWVRSRVEEIRRTLRERQEGHLNAILQAGVPHNNTRAFGKQLVQVEETIRDRIRVMVANDIQLSLRASVVLYEAVSNICFGGGALYAIGFVVSSAATDGAVGFIVATIMSPATFAMGALASLTVGFPVAIVAVLGYAISGEFVDEGYVRKRFNEMYEKVVEEYPDKVAQQEHDCIVKQAKTDLEEQRESLQCLRKEVGSRDLLDDEFKTESSKLQEKFTSLKKRCNEMLNHFMK